MYNAWRLAVLLVVFICFLSELGVSYVQAQSFEKENGEDPIVFNSSGEKIHSVYMNDDKSHDNLPPGVVFQAESEALDYDIGLLASELGLPFNEIERAVVFQEAF